MNKKFYLILAAGIVLLFLSVLFPPWVVFTHGPTSVTELPYGYKFLFTAPEPDSPNVSMRVDFVTLFLEWLGLLLVVGLLLWRERRRERAAKRRQAEE